MLRRMILIGCLFCLGAALAQYEPQKTQTRESFKLQGAVASVVSFTGPGEWRDGQWRHPEGTATAESRMEFDAGVRLLLHTMRNGLMNSDERISYDAAGRMLTRKVTREYKQTGGIRAPKGEDETYTYDAAGRLITFSKTIQVQAERTRVTTYRYDAEGHCLEATAVDAQGANLGSSRWTYDAKGREIEFLQHEIINDRRLRRSTTYNDTGATVKTELSMGERVQRTETETLDLQGLRTAWDVVSPIGPDSQEITHETVRNATWGQQRSREVLRKDREVVKPTSSVVEYLSKGQMLLTISAAENIRCGFRLQSFNRQGMLTGQFSARTPMDSSLQLPPPSLTSFTYDAMGNWVAKVDFEYTLDKSGDLVLVDGQPKMKRTVTTRTITYANPL